MTRFQNYLQEGMTEGNGRHPRDSQDAMEMLVSGISGLALGAALMYLFDPNSGAKRRERLGEAAGNAMEGTASTLSSLTSSASSAVSGMGDYIGSLKDRSRDMRDEYSGRMASTYQGLRKSLGRYVDRASDSAHSTYRDFAKSAQRQARKLPSFSKMRFTTEDEGFSGGSLAASAFGALALGCCAMYFLDPRLGRSRRAYIMQKAGKFVRNTGDLAHKTGRHLANKSRGYYHEVAGALPANIGGLSDQSILQRVKSMFTRSPQTEKLEASCDSGCVSIMGECEPNAVSDLLIEIETIPGVWEVRNQTRGYDMSSSTGSQRPNPTAM